MRNLRRRWRLLRYHWHGGREERYPLCCIIWYVALSQFTHVPDRVMQWLMRRPEGEWEWCSENNAERGGYIECPLHVRWACWRRTGYWARVQTRYEDTPNGLVVRCRMFQADGWTPWQEELWPPAQP